MFQAIVPTFPLKACSLCCFLVPPRTLIGLLFLEPREKAKGLTSTKTNLKCHVLLDANGRKRLAHSARRVNEFVKIS